MYLAYKIRWNIFFWNAVNVFIVKNWCILWSTTRDWALWDWRNAIFRFFLFFCKLFLGGDSIPTLHLETFNIFFLDPDFRKIYRSMRLTASMWHQCSMHRVTFLKSESEKNEFEIVNSTYLFCTFEFFRQCSAGN